MKRELRTQVLVVGGGMAGLCAAVRALQAGRQVLVLEKGTRLGGSMALSNGLVWTFAETQDVRRHVPDGDEALQDMVVGEFEDALAWLVGLGVELEPAIRFCGYGIGRRASGAQMTSALQQQVESLGGRICLNTGMQALRETAGRVDGVLAFSEEGPIEIRADAIVLATGGFQGNPELLARWVTPHSGRMYLRSNPWSTGDGLLAASDVGAALGPNLDTFYGHAVTAPPARFNAYEFQAMSHKYGQYAVALDLNGRRFVDESQGTGEEHLNYHLAGQPHATGIYVIDAAIGEQSYDGGPLPRVALARARQAGGPVIEAHTLELLAQQMQAWGPDPEVTLQTLQQYNRAVGTGRGAALQPPRRCHPLALLQPPFSAVLVRASVTFTCGGLRADLDMRVLRRSGSISMLPLVTADASELQVTPIEGLYVAGCDVGGTNSVAYMGGLAHALVTGRTAGASAADA